MNCVSHRYHVEAVGAIRSHTDATPSPHEPHVAHQSEGTLRDPAGDVGQSDRDLAVENVRYRNR